MLAGSIIKEIADSAINKMAAPAVASEVGDLDSAQDMVMQWETLETDGIQTALGALSVSQSNARHLNRARISSWRVIRTVIRTMRVFLSLPSLAHWSVEEKSTFLDLKLEASRAGKGRDWGFISEALRERHGFNRRSCSCEHQWDTLCKDFTAIQGFKVSSQTSEWVSFWDMDEDERSRNKLPRVFPVEWFTMIVRIFAAQDGRSGKKSRGIAEQECFEKVAIWMNLSVGPAGDGINHQTQGQSRPATIPGLLDHRRRIREKPKEDDLTSQVSRGNDTELDVTGGNFPNLHRCPDREQNLWLVESEINPTLFSGNLARDPLMDLSRSNHNPRFSELMSVLVSYFRQRIDDALEPVLGPVASACQSQGGDRTMKAQRKKFLALEEKKLAQRREKIQRLKRHRAGRFQPSRRASSARPSRPRVRQGLRKGKSQG